LILFHPAHAPGGGAAHVRPRSDPADSDERVLRDAGATEILRSLDQLPQMLGLTDTADYGSSV
jgi:hypothetical protein